MKAKGVAPPEGHKPLFCILPRKQIYRLNGKEILPLDLQRVGSGNEQGSNNDPHELEPIEEGNTAQLRLI